MCIDDNIPADNYCGIILKAEQQEDTDIYGNVKWRRIYLWVDVAKGFYPIPEDLSMIRVNFLFKTGRFSRPGML